jgi:hypothetical protein
MQSKLIESALMRIPLPVFYLAERDDGKIVVVDGLQRLTTFRRYLDNEFALSKLESKDKPENNPLKGKRFRDLPTKLQNRIEDTNLILYLIDHKVPEQAKMDIFERVNSGVKLTRQQMRNSMHVGKGTRWLKDAAQSPDFLNATGGSLNAKTMRDRECINRFCGFFLFGPSNYRGNMDSFLAETLRKMNTMAPEELQTMRAKFDTSMRKNFEVFGRHAFRKHSPTEAGRKPLNVALFDVYSVLLANVSEEAAASRKDAIQESFYSLMGNEVFRDAISLSTNSTRQVQTRFELASNALNQVMNNVGQAQP